MRYNKRISDVGAHRPPNIEIPHFINSNLKLTEDVFGVFYEDCGRQKPIRRYTWNNHNNIQVQVITYGARITSIKFPNNKGVVEDIVLGFEDLAGYMYYEKHMLGAAVGRVSDRVENATFEIDGRQYWLTRNDGRHHINGGKEGFDKVIWSAYVKDTTVIMSHVFDGIADGYPGKMFVQIFFSLSSMNEFSITIEAHTSKPTIVNISNMVYFNLAGHNQGASELYKHTLTVNANCLTNTRDDGFPDGVITNVLHTNFDFQIPKLLAKIIGINPEDGINQFLCINRGVTQYDCFVARLLHSPSGRMVEIYSNQPGVKISTANRFGSSLTETKLDSKVLINEKRCSPHTSLNVNLKGSILKVGSRNILKSANSSRNDIQNCLDMIDKLHQKMASTMELDQTNDFTELRDLIRRIKANQVCGNEVIAATGQLSATPLTEDNPEANIAEIMVLVLKPPQVKYLEGLRDIAKVDSVTGYADVTNIIEKLIGVGQGEMTPSKMLIDLKTEAQAKKKKAEEEELKRKAMIRMGNYIPSFYKDGKIHGKGGAIYSKHGGICFQTQNYPNAIYHKTFPSCILKPEEVYKHTITYKFWIRQGDPNKFNRRYRKDMKNASQQRHVTVA